MKATHTSRMDSFNQETMENMPKQNTFCYLSGISNLILGFHVNPTESVFSSFLFLFMFALKCFILCFPWFLANALCGDWHNLASKILYIVPSLRHSEVTFVTALKGMVWVGQALKDKVAPWTILSKHKDGTRPLQESGPDVRDIFLASVDWIFAHGNTS